MLTRLTPLLALLLLLIVGACGELDDASEPDATSLDANDDSLSDEAFVGATPPPAGFDADAATYQPAEGVWIYRRGAIEDNTCGDFASADADTPFRISYSAGGTFVIEQGEPWGRFACFVLGAAFECPERGSGSVEVEGTGAVVDYVVSIAGTLTSDDALSGTQRAELTCSGASCALAPVALGVSFPCSWTLPFTAERAL